MPDAVRCADPFHVVGWATEALDAVRREAWNNARRAGHTRPHGWAHGRRATVATGPAQALRRARYALWKNPENLTDRQRVKLDWIATTDPRLYRAYLLKEGLRTVFKLPADQAAEALDRWVAWARRCRIESFVTLQRRIVGHRTQILASKHGLSIIERQHQDPTHHPHGLRLRRPQPSNRPGNAHLPGGHRPTLPGRQ